MDAPSVNEALTQKTDSVYKTESASNVRVSPLALTLLEKGIQRAFWQILTATQQGGIYSDFRAFFQPVEQVRHIQQGVLAPGEQATVAQQHCRCRRIVTNGFDNRVGRITRCPVAQWDFIHARPLRQRPVLDAERFMGNGMSRQIRRMGRTILCVITPRLFLRRLRSLVSPV